MDNKTPPEVESAAEPGAAVPTTRVRLGVKCVVFGVGAMVGSVSTILFGLLYIQTISASTRSAYSSDGVVTVAVATDSLETTSNLASTEVATDAQTVYAYKEYDDWDCPEGYHQVMTKEECRIAAGHFQCNGQTCPFTDFADTASVGGGILGPKPYLFDYSTVANGKCRKSHQLIGGTGTGVRPMYGGDLLRSCTYEAQRDGGYGKGAKCKHVWSGCAHSRCNSTVMLSIDFGKDSCSCAVDDCDSVDDDGSSTTFNVFGYSEFPGCMYFNYFDNDKRTNRNRVLGWGDHYAVQAFDRKDTGSDYFSTVVCKKTVR